MPGLGASAVSRVTIAGFRTSVLTLHNPTLATSYGASRPERQHVFVQLLASTGEWGVGEASPLPHFTGEQAETIRLVVENVLAPALLGAQVADIGGIQARLDRALPKNGTAKNALITAAYDLAGRVAGQPVCHLVGGRLRSRVERAAGVGIMSPEETAAEARRLVEQGCGTIKLKVGLDPERDVGAVALTRQVVGSGVSLRADANQGYRPKDAFRALRGFRDYGLQYVEQPVAAWDLDSLAWLRRSVEVPIAVDESLYSPQDAIELIKRQAADVFVVKLIKAQGLYRARQILAIAEAAGIPCVLVSPYETTVGVAANLHLAAAAPNVPWAAEVGGDPIPGDPARGLRGEGTSVEVPSGPGLGIEVEEAIFQH